MERCRSGEQDPTSRVQRVKDLCQEKTCVLLHGGQHWLSLEAGQVNGA